MKASLAMVLKTNVEKMSTFGSTTMLMKTNGLYFWHHDVDENKQVTFNRRAGSEVRNLGGTRLAICRTRGSGHLPTWRFNHALDKKSQTWACATKKMLKEYVRSRNVYENKRNLDKMPD